MNSQAILAGWWKPAKATRPQAIRRTAWIELAVLLLVLEAFLWTDSKRVLPKEGRAVGAAAVALAAAWILAAQRPSPDDLGLRPDSWTAGIGILFAGTLLAAVALFFVGWFAESIGRTENFGRWFARNWYLEAAQQILLQTVMIPRLETIMGRRGIAVSATAGVIFSLLHAPNWILMGLTILAAPLWCEWQRRFRNLPAVWASHASLGAAALYCLNGPDLRMMRVGIGWVFYPRTKLGCL